MKDLSKNTFYIRDKYSKAILNTNVDEVKAYNSKKKQDKVIETLENQIIDLKNELREIKKLLTRD